MRGRLTLVLIGLALAAGLTSAGSWAYFVAQAEGSVRFSVAEVGSVKLELERVDGALTPGGSVTVRFSVSNPTLWTVRVGSVVLDQPGFTELPSGCPASVFGFKPVVLNAKLGPEEKVKGKGELTMSRSAPAECAGADPVLHLELAP